MDISVSSGDNDEISIEQENEDGEISVLRLINNTYEQNHSTSSIDNSPYKVMYSNKHSTHNKDNRKVALQ